MLENQNEKQLADINNIKTYISYLDIIEETSYKMKLKPPTVDYKSMTKEEEEEEKKEIQAVN